MPDIVLALPALNSRAPLIGKRNDAAPLFVAGSSARCQLVNNVLRREAEPS